jgi:hypothetical protein
MTEGSTRVLAITSDLFFMPKVQAIAQAAGCGFSWIDQPLTPAQFCAQLAAAPTALVLLDLGSALPWQGWLTAAKAEAALAAVPWLAYGPHTDAPRLAAARKAGVYKVVPRSQFAKALSEMLSGQKA